MEAVDQLLVRVRMILGQVGLLVEVIVIAVATGLMIGTEITGTGSTSLERIPVNVRTMVKRALTTGTMIVPGEVLTG